MDIKTIISELFQNPNVLVEHLPITESMIEMVETNPWQPEIQSNLNFSVLFPLGRETTDFYFYTNNDKTPFITTKQMQAMIDLQLQMTSEALDHATRDSIQYAHRDMYSESPCGPAEFDRVRPAIIAAMKNKLAQSS